MQIEHAIQDAYGQLFGGEQNLSFGEKALSIGLGLIMAAGGLRRADGPGAIMGLAGAVMVARGMSGHCAVKSMLTHQDQPRGYIH